MAAIDKLESLVAKLQAKAAKSKQDDNVSVKVGYQAAYAIFVHENLEAHHTNGQAKFLEQPAREMNSQLGQMVRDGLKQGLTMAQSLLRAGLALQRASQQLVPVDTGNLKGSAFTQLVEGQGNQ